MAKIGVLLIQLGTPDAPTPGAVRRYLREFLGDPRVVEATRWSWWLVLNFVILPKRSRESAAKYARIWDAQSGSPLLHITQQQSDSLKRVLPGNFVVQFGMRYGNPTIASAVYELMKSDADRIVVLPMYPQYSAAATATACDKLFDALSRIRSMPAIRVVPPFYAHPAYIRAQAAVVRAELARLDQAPQKVLFSFHGYPQEFVAKGDPYKIHVETTARLLARELSLADDQWLITYQSRFRNQVWLEPYTEDTLCRLARQGCRRIVVVSPGFTADCLETIDEIGREAAEAFAAAGGEQLIRCPCLNTHPDWIRALASLVIEESAGWYPMNPANQAGSDGSDDDATELDIERART